LSQFLGIPTVLCLRSRFSIDFSLPSAQPAFVPKTTRDRAPAQPHDALVKWTLTQRRHALSLVKAALPKEVVDAVDWSTFRIEKGSFVDDDLRNRYSDIVWSARLEGEEVFFYTLIEHQRAVEALMIFRMGLYMWRLWEHLVREQPERTTLPPIVPLLLHHSDTGWTAATAFEQIIAGKGPVREALERHIPHFELRLVDVSDGRAHNLADDALTGFVEVVLWCLSVAYDDERFEQEIQRRPVGKALAEAPAGPHRRAALGVLFWYLVSTHPDMPRRKISDLLLEAGQGAQEDVVDFMAEIKRMMRDEVKLEGKREGIREGKREGSAAILLDLLAARFGKVPVAVQARVEAADEKVISTWAVRVLTAGTLTEVLDGDAAGAPPKPRAAAHRAGKRR